jgi:hypothetical protein
MKRIAAVLVVLALAGCTDAATPAPTPTATATAAPIDEAVVPVVPQTLDATTAEAETVRLADEVQALIGNSNIVHVDDHAQVVDATDDAAAYYGVIRTVTLEETTDPIFLASTMVAVLEASGWEEAQHTDEGGIVLTALGSSGWFLLVGGDASVEGQSVITIQLASPDLP